MTLVVAIDGPSGSGKSTVARAVAAELDLQVLDTGAMYRAVTLAVIERGVSLDDGGGCAAVARKSEISVEHGVTRLDGRDVSAEIRTPEVSEMSSRLAARPLVRRRLADSQRRLRERGPLVGEGRDLGTVVFPDAEVKIYLDADLETRAHRRQKELERRGIPVAVDDVQTELARRDDRDRTREDSPLRVAEGAQVIDTSRLDVPQQVSRILDLVRTHPGFPGVAAGGERGAGSAGPDPA